MNRIQLVVASLALLAGTTAMAAERAGATLAIGRNVHVAGGSVTTPGDVAGDFGGFGGRVVVAHAVGADAALAGGSVQVAAPIGDDLRAAGGDVSVASKVGGGLYAAGGNVRLGPAAVVAGDAAIAAGTLTIDGTVAGTLQATAREIVVNGEVGGDASLRAERIALGPAARIGGALRYRAAAPPQKADGAVVVGAVLDTGDDEAVHPGSPRLGAVNGWHARMGHGDHWSMHGLGSTVGLVALLALSALVVLAAPRLPSRLAGAAARAPWSAAGVGAALIAGLPLLALLLMATLLGIPLAMALLMLYPVLLFAGFVAGVLVVAQRAGAALRAGAEPTRQGLLGLAGLILLAWVLLGWLPVLGTLALLALTVVGLGAMALALFAAGADAS